jgi:HAD superfamily hydrolase (TIGR01509 family)
MQTKIKAVLFDLDGVLVEAKEIHFNSLNEALPKKYKISWKEHLTFYDGLKTNQKLILLNERKGLPQSEFENIWIKKQKTTHLMLENIKANNELKKLFKLLKKNNLKVAVCSNSIASTVKTVLKKLQLFQYIDFIASNEDVVNSKPHPEIYWKAMTQFNIYPYETLIVEDSPFGLKAASNSGACVLRVKSPKELTRELIFNFLKSPVKVFEPKWKDEKLNVVIPMAGAGSRFQKAGFTFPKPLIEIAGKPMIQIVVDNLNIDANYIFIVQNEHRNNFNLDTSLNLIAPNCKIIGIDGITDGAACTALLAKEFIDNENPVFFANSDQFVEWSSNEFFYAMQEYGADGGIPTFKSTHPKWSFVRLDEGNNVVEVQEKNPISDMATVGFYYFKKGSEFVKNAEEMIKANDRVNGEFYLCPVYNYLIKNKGIVKASNIEEMWGLGTPEDLDSFLKLKFSK